MNRLLDGLSPRERARLVGRLQPMELAVREVLYEPDAPIAHVYFPLTAVLSIVLKTTDGHSGEIATIGNEGVLCTPIFFGLERGRFSAFAQVSGQVLRMTAHDFAREVHRGGAFGERMERYMYALFNQVAQAVVCNAYHPIQQRMSRWLLMTQDRVDQDVFPLTQEFLAQMLGVRRPSVSVVAGLLQKQGLIQYARGRITVRDRAGLESASCGCYRDVREEFERLLTRTGRARRRRPARRESAAK